MHPTMYLGLCIPFRSLLPSEQARGREGPWPCHLSPLTNGTFHCSTDLDETSHHDMLPSFALNYSWLLTGRVEV